MAQTVITSAFEQYKAQEAAGGRRIVLDQFVFANVPGLDPSASPGRDDPMPDDSQIVWRQNADTEGMISTDVVTYAVTLPESAGDFTFNWMGLLNSESGTLCHITHLEAQHKTRTADGRQGNVLTYSVNLKFSGASEQTGITTPASTWQIDFSARLHGMDEAARLAMLDLYGSALFFDDAFRLSLTSPGSATLSPGTTWLRGLRVVLDRPATLTFPADQEQVISLDCTLTGSLTGENRAIFTLISQPLRDYIDALGFAHYVEPVARIAADGTLTDLRRTRSPIPQQLDGEFLTVSGNLSEIAARGPQAQRLLRNNIGLGNSATRNVGTAADTVAAGDDSRITGAMQKNQNGADIPDKAAFIEHIGMKETINPTKRVSIGHPGDGHFDGSVPCINIGDSDSGFIGSADGRIDVYANNILIGWLDTSGLHMQRDISTTGILRSGNAQVATDGNIYGTQWGGWLRAWLDNQLNTRGTIDWIKQGFVQDVRLGTIGETGTINGGTADCPPGHVMVGAVMDVWGSRGSHLLRMRHSPLQKNVNGTWYNVTRL
ncbi:hypothetical protein DQY68_24175 [Salmonella enterica subsp. salamae]|nr:hypothetical protein [Salmonella enterica subsp. salamae]